MDFSLEFHTGCFGVTLGGLYLQSYILFHSLMIDFVLAKSADPDEMPPYAAFHLVLHCLPYIQVLKGSAVLYFYGHCRIITRKFP